MLYLHSVLASPATLPGFWIFMYRVSPFTYLVDGMLATGIGNTDIVCASNEYLHFAPAAANCGAYMAPHIAAYGGYLLDPGSTQNCTFCTMSSTNTFLASVSSSYSHRWRNFGIMWAYIIFNIFAAAGLYWLFRVPKKTGKKAKKE